MVSKVPQAFFPGLQNQRYVGWPDFLVFRMFHACFNRASPGKLQYSGILQKVESMDR